MCWGEDVRDRLAVVMAFARFSSVHAMMSNPPSVIGLCQCLAQPPQPN
jgi:hypothetical protein